MITRSVSAILVLLVAISVHGSLDHQTALDINDISLVQSTNLDRTAKSAWARRVWDLTANLSSASISEKVTSEVLKSLSDPKLKDYFSTEESRLAVAKTIEREIKSDLGGYVITSANLNSIRAKTTKLLTEHVLGAVFSAKKIGDPTRAKLWSDKITAPVVACILSRKSSAQGTRCSEKADKDLNTNIAMAVAYESSRKHLDPAMTRQTVTAFKTCIAKPSETPEQCGLTAVRSSAETFLYQKYKERQEQQLPGYSKDLSLPHRAAVSDCLNRAKVSDDFYSCGDILTIRAGADIARVKATLNPAVTENVQTSLLPKIGLAAETAYRNCILETQERDKDGALKSSVCEGRVRKAIGHEMRGPVLEDHLKENLADANITADAGKARLTEISAVHRSCIDRISDDRSSDADLLKCFQDSGREIADFLGDARFKNTLDKRMKDMAPEQRLRFHQNLMADYRTCLKAAQTKQALENCAVNSAQTLTTQLGQLRFRSQLKAALGPRGLERESAELAQIERTFLNCVSSKKNYKTLEDDLEKCSADLRAAGTELAKRHAAAVFIKPGDSEKVIALKKDIIDGIEPLSRLMPQRGPSEGTEQGTLDRALNRLDEVIRYNPQAAEGSLRQVLQESRREGATTTTVAETLIKSGTVDQMIKAAAYKQIVARMKSLEGDQIPSKKVLNTLLSKKNFEKIFSPQVMARLRGKFPNEIAMLVKSGATEKQVEAAMARIKKEVASILVESPNFGRLYAKDRIEDKIRKELVTQGFSASQAPSLPDNRMARRTVDRFLELLLRPVLVGNRSLTEPEQRYGIAIVKRYARAAFFDEELPEERRHIANERRAAGVQ